MASSQDDFFQAIDRGKSRAYVAKKRPLPIFLMAGLVAGGIAIGAILVLVLQPVSGEERVRRSLKTLIEEDKAKSEAPRPIMLKVSNVTFKNSYFEKSSSDAVLAWKFQFTLTNTGNDVETDYDFHARTIRDGRAAHDFMDYDVSIPIRGGIHPKESIVQHWSIECAKLNGSEALGWKLPPSLRLQVSLDGKNWVEATQIDDPIPKDDQLDRPSGSLGF